MTTPTLYETYSGSVKSRDKPHNGDRVFVGRLGDSELLLGIVADGVGSRPCDWLASKTVVESILKVLPISSGDIESRMRESILFAHHQVAGQSGACKGMLSGLAMVVWEPGADYVYTVNIADVRTYKVTSTGLVQISIDDTASYLVRARGKLHLMDGSPIAAKGITNAMGQEGPLSLKVETHPFLEGESILLVSDGAYGSGDGAFTDRCHELTARSEILDSALSSMLEGCSQSNSDDASLVLIRRNDVPGSDFAPYERALASGAEWKHSGLFGHLMTRFVSDALLNSVRNGEISRAESCIAYFETHASVPSWQELDSILHAIYQHCPREVALFRRAQRILRRMPGAR